MVNETLHVLTADQRKVIAELRPIKVEQHVAMACLLFRHLVEDLGRSGVALAQSLSEAAIDPIVLLLIGNGESEDFLFGELGKAFHIGLVIDAISSVMVPCLLRLRRVRRRHSDEAHHSFILMTQDMAVEHKSSRYIASKMHEQPNLAGCYRIAP